jgi:hypothetical protein
MNKYITNRWTKILWKKLVKYLKTEFLEYLNQLPLTT